jgi:hypothetical protein
MFHHPDTPLPRQSETKSLPLPMFAPSSVPPLFPTLVRPLADDAHSIDFENIDADSLLSTKPTKFLAHFLSDIQSISSWMTTSKLNIEPLVLFNIDIFRDVLFIR